MDLIGVGERGILFDDYVRIRFVYVWLMCRVKLCMFWLDFESLVVGYW